jgi:OOP family OmpA-OmpF porin
LAACASDIQRVRSAEGTGSPFTRALTTEYKDFSTFEADEMNDWSNARHFARKGMLASQGEVVQPEDLGNWKLPHGRVDELTAARAKLVGLLDAGARDRVPEPAARAQARFDCWVEQQEENHQPDHISACRDQFFAALAEVQQAAPAAATPAAVQPETYVAYFDWNKATLKPEATQIIDKAIAAAKAGGTPSISVTGHADRSGSEDYNLKLSLKRADAVREYLIKNGIAAEQITVSGRGEAEPAVPTADGVKEPRNRRVEIIVQ